MKHKPAEISLLVKRYLLLIYAYFGLNLDYNQPKISLKLSHILSVRLNKTKGCPWSGWGV